MDESQRGDSAKENESVNVTTEVEKDETKNEERAKDKRSEKTTETIENVARNQQRRSGDFTNSGRHRTFYYSQKQYSAPNCQHSYQSQVTPRNGAPAGTARERRNEFADRHVKSGSQTQKYRNNSKNWGTSTEKPSRVDKTRSLSTTVSNIVQIDANAAGERTGVEKKQRRQRNSTNGMRTTSNSLSNGESFDYDEMELEEPFSESDDETPGKRASQKPCLIIPRGRIRSLSGTIPPVGYSPHWGGPTMCVSCLQFFQLPEMVEDFSAHLLSEHQIVIEGIDIIVDLKRYIEHWRQKFSKRSIAEIFPKILPAEDSPLFGRVDYYFEMTENVKEDYALRQRLAMRRLEEALACQQRERDDATFSMQCIFCRYQARGNRAKIIHHLYTIHHLNLGSPDNLVFVTEYIEHLRERLLRNECIYCEKTYADRNTLMEHMRKKNHREVNPKNSYYDKFYIINYLELGKRWLDVLAEDFEDTMPTFVDSDEEEEEESWNEWEEDNAGEEDLCALCLFCDRSAETLDELSAHMNENHKFDVIGYIHDQGMGTYDRMKFVNFLRKQTYNTRTGPLADSKFAEIPDREEWDKEEHLVPMFGNDHLLWMLESWYLEQEMNGTDGKKEEDTSQTGKEEEPIGGPKIELSMLIEESKKNTVEGVIAEELPDLAESILASSEMQQTLR